ncbi:MAG: DNA alkylation repair protein [Lachnospiraceae bacterium]|nr:DNA alkylation repair protein [Lachnospiraceae bacterium]MBP5565035.1 DNA alkylation repair protein [Lachnospiraceae bacterium]MBQ4275670.1 DNA alkylation repair protein [Lachnospiraceae bacterium]
MSKINAEIKNHLYELKETDYKEFMAKLIPTVDPGTVLGIRTPALRNYAKELAKRDDIDEFLHSLPHELFDENQLHAFILSELKDYDRCIKEVDNFLSYVDNWATCDQLSPKVFKKHKKELLVSIKTWLKSKDTYTIRFAIGMLMQYFLDDEFDETYPKTVAKIKSDEYYINMMIAWYFATALAKQYDAILPYIEKNVLDKWTHNKTIQKAIESYRITDEQKEYLKSLKIK